MNVGGAGGGYPLMIGNNLNARIAIKVTLRRREGD